MKTTNQWKIKEIFKPDDFDILHYDKNVFYCALKYRQFV